MVGEGGVWQNKSTKITINVSNTFLMSGAHQVGSLDVHFSEKIVASGAVRCLSMGSKHGMGGNNVPGAPLRVFWFCKSSASCAGVT